MPKGLKVICIINILASLVLSLLAFSIPHAPSSKIFSILFGWLLGLSAAWGLTVILTCVRRPASLIVIRAIFYGLALVYTLCGIIQFAAFGWLINFIMLALMVVLVLYLIGARGYLNEPEIRMYFRA